MTSPTIRSLFFAPILLLSLFASANTRAAAQSDAVSRASGASLEASVHVPVAAFEALRSSGQFSIVAVQTVARGTVLTIVASGVTFSVLTTMVVEPGYNFSSNPQTSVGKAVMGSAGLLLKVGDKVVAFIPEPRVRPHIHSRKLES